MLRYPPLIAVIAICAIFTPLLPAQDWPFDAPMAGSKAAHPLTATGRRAEVPRPAEVLGFRAGTRHVRPEEITRYLERLAEASPLVSVHEHARSHEGRRLIHAVITSERNHARLDEIRAAAQRRITSPQSVNQEELEHLPVTIYMGYGVHGDEASAHESSIQVAWHLASGLGPQIEALLEHCVIVLDPSLNPDGHDRFVDWVNGRRGKLATTDRNDLERRQPWPRGRTNHYHFDLNRDWVPLVHPESRGRLAMWRRFRPQLSLDFHEMGSQSCFFFQPGIPERENPLTPDGVRDLTRRIAGFHAKAFDGVKQLYFTREIFDDYYYGKGSSYPDVNGCIGILFEQASSRGLRAATAAGELRYPKTIRNQVMASLSSLQAAAKLRRELLAWQRDFYASAVSFAEGRKTKAWVFPMEGQIDRLRQLVDTLGRHGIRVHRHRELSGGVVVPVAQPQARLVVALLEEVSELPSTTFYDVTTWPLPHAYGLSFEKLEECPPSLLGELVSSASFQRRGGILGDAEEPTAWILPWNDEGTAPILHALQRDGAVVRALTRPAKLTIEGREVRLSAGTLIVPADQPRRFAPEAEAAARIQRRLQELVEAHGVRAEAVSSALVLEGQDLGSPSLKVLTRPRVALVAGSSASVYRFGEIWHYLSEVSELELTTLEDRRLGGVALEDYDVLILPGGNHGAAFGEAGTAALKEWLRGGGTLIALGRSARWASAAEIVPVDVSEIPLRVAPDLNYAERRRAGAELSIPGSVFEAGLDATHPLSFGLPSPLSLFRINTLRFGKKVPAGTAVGRYTARALVSGYAPEAAVRGLRGSPAIWAGRVGSGRAVCILDAPCFRGFWIGSRRLLLNAVHFGRTF